MKTRFVLAALFATLSQPVLASDAYWSRVDASFDAMLTHQPYAGPTAVTVARGEDDAAAALIHARLRGESPALVAQASTAQDPVAASFTRMLTHEPHLGPTAVTVAQGETDTAAALMYAAVRGETGSTTTVAVDFKQDEVTASFGRMLAHDAYTGPTAITVARQQDHEVDRLVFARRQSLNTTGTVVAKH